MERRALLSTVAAGVAIGFAGCTGGAGTATRTPDDDTPSPTESRTETPDPGPEVSFEVGERACGRGANEATVEFAGDAVEVDGVIGGRDTCDTAVLDRASASDGVLRIRVAVRRESGGSAACAECLTDIDYGATVRFDGDLPATVVVVHESADGIKTVAREER